MGILFSTIIAIIISFEILFRILYWCKFKRNYRFVPRHKFKEIHIEPHPYLPFVYKKHAIPNKIYPLPAPLHKDKGYSIGGQSTNNYRHANGEYGDRDIVTPKPKEIIRINCIGASTTGNYITHRLKNYSYPMELEYLLKQKLPSVEVNNCGQGGYNSAAVMIKFLLDTIDSQPDIVILYHAYNDLFDTLIPTFSSDCSHSRINIAGKYNLYRIYSYLPFIPLAFIDYFMRRTSLSDYIVQAILKDEPTKYSYFQEQGFVAYRRNIKHIIDICIANKIKIILSTFCFYLYEKQDFLFLLSEGVKRENEIIRELAKEYNLPLVDNANLIPQDEKYFVDAIHFSPEGMKILASNFEKSIIEYINDHH